MNQVLLQVQCIELMEELGVRWGLLKQFKFKCERDGRAWSDECQTGANAHPGQARSPKVERIEVSLERNLYKFKTKPFGDSPLKDI